MFEVILGTISVAISKTILSIWLDDSEFVYAASNTIYSIINSKVHDNLKARDMGRRFKDIEDRIANNLSTTFTQYNKENCNIEVVANEVMDTILATQIDGKTLAQLSYKPKELHRLMNKSRSIEDKHFSANEVSIYDRMLDLSSQYIINIAPTIPTYEKSNFEEIFDRFDEFHATSIKILNDLNTLIVLQGNSKEDKFSNFEHDYRVEVARKYDKLEVIGAKLDRKYSRYNLSIAYVSLDWIQRKVMSTLTIS